MPTLQRTNRPVHYFGPKTTDNVEVVNATTSATAILDETNQAIRDEANTAILEE